MAATPESMRDHRRVDTHPGTVPRLTHETGQSLVDTHDEDAGLDSINAGIDQPRRDTQTGSVDPGLIFEIRKIYRARTVAVKAMSKLTLQIKAECRSLVSTGAEESDSDRTKQRNAADELYKAMQERLKTPGGKMDALTMAGLFNCEDLFAAIVPLEAGRKLRESQLKKLAEQLPVWDAWGRDIRGLGALTLGKIIGETGDLNSYDTPSRVWKRMGLAVLDGKRQGAPGIHASKEDWIRHGYSKQRRSVMYLVGDGFVKNGEHYRDLINERKLAEIEKALDAGKLVTTTAKATAENWEAAGLPRPIIIKKSEYDEVLNMSCGHIAKRAQRWVEKRFLRDLWQAWRRS